MKEVIRRRTSEKKFASNYFKMIQNTIQTRGFSTGLAAAILGGVSSLSYFFSGFQPGYEFLTAIEYVESQQERCDVVLADRLVDETLRRVGALPSVALEMWRQFIDSGLDWEGTYGREMTNLFNAISGQGNFQVDMKRTLFRNTDVIVDLARLILPTFLIVEAGNIALGLIFQEMAPTLDLEWMDLGLVLDLSSLSSSTSLSDWSVIASEVVFEVISSGMALFLGFLLVALPISRVILSERDEQLARGIDVACNIASRNHGNHGGRVVAILGMLHVNGVAKRILPSE
jgi:pheromone shutdown protein TraB